MIRLIAAGLARQGIAVPMRRPSGARFPRAAKRKALEAVIAGHGRMAILRIADAARHMPPEPVSLALLKARSLADLLDRWHRLERFSHGRHRVRVETMAETRFGLCHGARDAKAAPSEAETLLVMGLLAVLAEIVTSAPVDLVTAQGRVWRRAGVWCEPGAFGADQRFVLSGAPVSLGRSPGPGHAHKDLVDALRRRLAADPLRRWTLAELAAETGTSRRTLQRRMNQGYTSFSRLVAETRLLTAARYLCDRPGPGLAEIGFLSGYCDQAHFTRSFTRSVGTTPRAYRVDFAG